MQTRTAPINTHTDAIVTTDSTDPELASIGRALKAAAVFVALTGLLFSAGAMTSTDFGVRFLLDIVFFRVGDGPDALEESHRLVNAVLGGVMVGWGAMIWLLVDRFLARSPGDVKRVLVIGLATWFVVDCAGSIASGGWLNAILNIGFVAPFIRPLRKLP